MKTIIFRITSAMLLVLLMLSVFMLSSETAEESSETSGGFTFKVFSVLVPGFSDMSEAEQEEMIVNASFYIRKFAHFSIYAVMGAFSLLTFISYRKMKLFLRLAVSFSVCVLYCVGDEIHQFFVPGRSCELRDMCIDSSGALLGILLCFLLVFFICRKMKINLKNID